MKIVKEGFWVIVPSAIIPILLIWITSWRSWGLIFIFTVIMVFFFRDPNRLPPSVADGILAPADGRILLINKSSNILTLFIELSFLNCHLQRAPMSGVITQITRRSGHKRRFYLIYPKFGSIRKKVRAVMENKQNIIEIKTENATKIWLTQIVGAFARRLKSYVKVGDKVQKGEKVGLIYFGSMVKLEMQGQFDLQVKKGDKVKAGETIIAFPKNL
ncbi:MAG: phosphatidylserine decarboxylase [Candidatus Helarchaeota archaeon]